MKQTFCFLSLFTAILLLSLVPLFGQATIEPILTNAVADLDTETLAIFGENFDPMPQVFLGTNFGTLVELDVNFSSNTKIEVALTTTAPGTYLLIVSNGIGSQMSAMDVTINTVGPEGPPGADANPNIITEAEPTANTAIGVAALINNTGTKNTASGVSALEQNTTGSFNTAVGRRALRDNTTGRQNTATGASALISNIDGGNNTAIGISALRDNTSGNDNTAIGALALVRNTTGMGNTAVGLTALEQNDTGMGNTAVGRRALNRNTTGRDNTATGRAALLENTSGSFNTASGVGAANSTTTGCCNTAIGASALVANTTGERNTAMGSSALQFSTGANNTAIGFQALFFNTTGSDNIALGFGAGISATTGNNNIYIGNTGFAAESNTIRIGTGGVHTNAFIAGVPIVAPSSKRFKEDINDMGKASTSLMRLRPVTFRYKKEYDAGDGRLQYGLIAEEVAEVYPELVVYDDQGRVKTVLYQQLSGMLLNELQRQHRQVQELTERLARLEQVLTAQQSFAALTE